MLRQFVIDLVTLFVVVDPVGVAVIFASLMRHANDEARRRAAIVATGIAAILLLAFALFGRPFLGALGISIPAFRIAGGILLFLLATDMVFARPSGIRNPTVPEQAEAARSADVSVFPLAFPLLAGPGAFTSVVLLTGRATSPLEFADVIAALALVMGGCLVALLGAAYLVRFLGVTGANVVGRVLGIILAALAAQLVLDGITGFLGPGT
jgi:multiple antibiotic resistance protein